MFLKSSVPINGSPNEIIDALNKFTDNCDEFISPICETITIAEINRVLNAAQKAYRILDIIAPKEPLKILRFDYSHTIYNSQCGLSNDKERPATIMVFHPKTADIHDRVFIFAHELGHALHQALTGDAAVTPDGFDEFNEPFSTKPNTTYEMQEFFADAVAHAILNVKGLGTHFLSQFGKNMSPIFARYLRGLCENVLQERDIYNDPLPPINLMIKASSRLPY